MAFFPFQITIGLAAIAAGAIIAGSASSFPARRPALERCAGILLITGLALLGSLLAPLVID